MADDITAATAECPLCDWVGRTFPVDRKNPNGVWFARNNAMVEYRQHYDKAHLRFHYPNIRFDSDDEETTRV